jgi:diguanylate cyclase (GGDEF)-like protein
MVALRSDTLFRAIDSAAGEGSHRLRNVAIAFAGLGLPVALLLTQLVIASSMERQSRVAVEAGRAAAARLDHELALREHAVEVIVANAEQILDGRVKSPVDVVAHLRARPEQGGYSLGWLPGYGAAEVCSLMGEGAVPARGSESAAEMQMAVALTPSFRVLRDRGVEIPWAYYISRRGFLYICPRSADDAFLWSHSLLKRYDLERVGARPQANRLVWSPTYQDDAGKGLMTTLSGLVVHEGRTIGDVSIDVGVATLTERLAHHGLPDATLRLLTADGVDVVGAAPRDARINPRAMALNTPARVGDAEVVLCRVPSTGWHVAVVTPRRAMLARALRESLVYGLMAAFVLASIALLLALARALRTLEAISVRDPLTGVYNRRHFDECIRVELSKARRMGAKLGVAILDVDHFKSYNDRYGHHAGDQALRAVAKALGGSLQRLSDLLFRIGGEEFAVIVYADREEQVVKLGEKLCAAVRALDLAHKGSPLGYVTISVGATLVDPVADADPERAYKSADAALYQAKAAGRNRVTRG